MFSNNKLIKKYQSLSDLKSSRSASFIWLNNNPMKTKISSLTFQNIAKNHLFARYGKYRIQEYILFINALLRNIILSSKILPRFGGKRDVSSYLRWQLKVDENKPQCIRDLALMPRLLWSRWDCNTISFCEKTICLSKRFHSLQLKLFKLFVSQTKHPSYWLNEN